MGREWRSECSTRAGIILEKVNHGLQGWAVTRAWLSPFPSLSREAQLQLTMTAADCVGYVFVCTCPTSQMDWTSPPNLRDQCSSKNLEQSLSARTWDQAATDTGAQQDLDSFKFRYMLPKCNGTITTQQVFDVGQGHKQIISCAGLEQHMEIPM